MIVVVAIVAVAAAAAVVVDDDIVRMLNAVVGNNFGNDVAPVVAVMMVAVDGNVVV